MTQQEYLQQLADQYAKSLTTDTVLYEQFLIDYFQQSPKSAFEKLNTSEASAKTKVCAEDFNARIINENLTQIQEQLEGVSISPSTRQAHVIQSYFKEYFETGEFDLAWRNAQQTISSDHELNKDKAFKVYMGKLAEEMKPKMKQQADYNNQEDDGAFIKVRPGLEKNVEHKLSHHKVMKIMEDSLKKFYTMNSPQHQMKREPQIQHEVESIYKRRQLPLALQLAHQDTMKHSEKTTVEIRDLATSISQVKKLHRQGNKFDFTMTDLEKAKSAKLPRPTSSTERMEVIRDLIIDLQTKPGGEAFKTAIQKTLAFEDKDLLKVLEKNFSSLTTGKSLEGQASMLMDGYKLYIKIDTALYKEDVHRETEQLTKGFKAEPLKLALDELHKKSESQTTAEALNRFFQRTIHAVSLANRQSSKNSFIKGVEAVAKKTAVEIELEKSRAQPPAQGKTPDKGVGINLN